MDLAQERPKEDESPSFLEVLGRANPLRVVLLAVVVVQLVVLAFMPYERRQAWTWLRSTEHRAQAWWLSRHDPRPGAPIRWSDYGLQVPSPGPAGIIALNDCEGCSLRAVYDLAVRLKSQRVTQLYTVAQQRPKPAAIQRMQADCQKLGIEADLLWDRTGALRRDLNAYFLPRAYQLGSTGTLTWVQRPGEAINPADAS
jgi:hypothetical protein